MSVCSEILELIITSDLLTGDKVRKILKCIIKKDNKISFIPAHIINEKNNMKLRDVSPFGSVEKYYKENFIKIFKMIDENNLLFIKDVYNYLLTLDLKTSNYLIQACFTKLNEMIESNYINKSNIETIKVLNKKNEDLMQKCDNLNKEIDDIKVKYEQTNTKKRKLNSIETKILS